MLVNEGSRRIGLLVGAVALILAMFLLVVTLHIPLVTTMGITVVVFALFVSPRQTLVLAVIAVVAAGLALRIVPFDMEWYRFGNTTAAAVLGIGVSWAVQRRAQHLASARRTQDMVFAQVPDGLAVLDGAGVLTQHNPGLVVLVPSARNGQPLHPLLGHVRADGSPCPGGCPLDSAGESAPTPVEGEWITRNGRRVAVEYTAAHAEDRTVVSLRDVTALRQAAEDRRLMVAAAARQGEQEALLKVLGAPAYAELPEVPGLAFDLYSTHSVTQPGGGDLVHVTGLADGRTLVTIVDALGQGVNSVRDAWKVQYVAQSYVMSGTPLRDVVTRTAEALAAETEMPNASVMLATIDPTSGVVEVVGGGHPPALLIRENGAAEWLEGGGPGIGFGVGGPEDVHRRELVPGDSLVFYTDGLIDGMADVIEALGTVRASAAALRRHQTSGWARTLATAVTQDQPVGSATVLLVRVTGSGDRQTMATL